ncbi:MAG TPA: Fic family protein [Acidimicrobiales bacterium]|nr:Fic family protein [Acidimicrobiales bacterium]
MASDMWPAVGWEQLDWNPSSVDVEISRAEALRQTGPYLAAVPPSIATLPLALPAELSGEVSEATAAIARFDVEMGADLLPFSSILLRSEAAASSQIEHLTASARAIATAEIGQGDSRNAVEVVANSRTMTSALALADHLDKRGILTMHSELMSDRPDIAGRWRSQQVWIGRGIGGPRLADFVPPRHALIDELMDDLVLFMGREDMPALAQAAIAHAQFETIHPFVDGNGRVGRALVHALLRGKGVTTGVTVPVSAGLLSDVESYFGALTTYRNGDPSDIIELTAAASRLALANARHLVSDLRSIRTSWSVRIVGRRDSAVWRAADIVLRQPVINHGTMNTELGITNADRYIRELTEAGILTEFSGKHRNRLWRSVEVLDALDRFAARAGNRGR